MTSTLLRHFLAQFASFEAVSPSGHARRAVIAIVSLMAAPGYLMAVVTARGARRAALQAGGAIQPELWLWRQEWTLFVVSLAAVMVVVALQWQSLLLGDRDYRILGVLPVPRRTVTVARLASVAVVVLLLHGAINALPGIILPIASPLGYLRPLVALQLALLLQTTFVCAFVVSAQGLLGLLLPGRLVRSGTSILQFGLLLCAVFVFLWSAPLSRLAYALRDGFAPLNAMLPVVWFRALYLRLAGVSAPYVGYHALQAVLATVAATAVAVPCCLVGYRDASVPAPGPRRRWPRRPRAVARPGSHPAASGVSLFVRRAATGSGTVALVARGWFAVGLALCLSGLGALLLRQMGRDAPLLPAAPSYAPAIVLPFFALVGLRLAAVVPASIEANWIFRLTETPRSPAYAEGVRSAALRLGVWPVLAVLGAAYAVLWGPGRSLALVILALAIARASLAWLFFGFSRVPFTCTYQPGKANLRVSWPVYAGIFLLYCGVLPALVERLLASPLAYAVALAAFLVASEALVRLDERALTRAGRLTFEDREPSPITALDLAADVQRPARRPERRADRGPAGDAPGGSPAPTAA